MTVFYDPFPFPIFPSYPAHFYCRATKGHAQRCIRNVKSSDLIVVVPKTTRLTEPALAALLARYSEQADTLILNRGCGLCANFHVF